MITHIPIPQDRIKGTVKTTALQEVNTNTLNCEGKPPLFNHIDKKPLQALVDTVISEKLAKQCTDRTIEPTSVKALTITADEITLPSPEPHFSQVCLLGMNFIEKLESLSSKTTD
jgi:hypothetical protein